MTAGPIRPTPSPSSFQPKGAFRKGAIYEQMRKDVFNTLAGLTYTGLPESIRREVQVLSDDLPEAQPFAEVHRQLQKAVGDYLTRVFDEMGDIVSFSEQVQGLAQKLFGTDLQREHLPTLFAQLLTTTNRLDALYYGMVIPYTPDGKITLDMEDPHDQQVAKILKARSTFSQQVPLETLASLFDTREKYQEFLEGWFKRAIATHPEAASNLAVVLTSSGKKPLSRTPEPTLLATLVKAITPHIVEKILLQLAETDLATIVDHSAASIKEHLDSIHETETKIDKIHKEIVWLKEGLLDGSIEPHPTLHHFSIQVWGKDLFNLTPKERKTFFNQNFISSREESYLQQQRFLAREPAGKKAVEKKLATVASQVLGAYLGDLITPDLIASAIEDLDKPNGHWPQLVDQFPPLAQLRRQLWEGHAREDDLIDFLPFVQEGLPRMMRGGIEWALQQRMVDDLLATPYIDDLFDKTLLPSAVVASHGVLISSLLANHRHEMVDAIYDPSLQPLLIDRVKADYQEIVQKEGLEIPPNLSIDDIVGGSVGQIRDRLHHILTTCDETTARNAILDYLANPPPGENVPIYPELILTAFDLVGIPRYFKNLIQATPIYPFVASHIAVAVTAALAPYTEDHQGVVQALTSLFRSLATPPKGEKSAEKMYFLDDRIQQMAKPLLALIKMKLGAAEPNTLLGRAFSLLPAERWMSLLLARAVTHPAVRNPLYLHQFAIHLLGGAK